MVKAFSAVTQQPVRATLSSTACVSSGLSVWMLTTSTSTPSPASVSAASSASLTMMPVANTVASRPFRSVQALPRVNSALSSNTFQGALRNRRMYTGPS